MKKIVIDIKGKPVGWQRAGVNNGRHFTQTQTRQYERMTRATFLSEYRESDAFKEHEAVKAEIYAYFERPNKTKLKFVTKKPDADNVSKIILDALNGLAYKDDSQIVALYVFKLWSQGDPHVRVELSEWMGVIDL